MVLYIDESVEKRFREHVLTKGYVHGDLQRIATEAIQAYLDSFLEM